MELPDKRRLLPQSSVKALYQPIALLLNMGLEMARYTIQNNEFNLFQLINCLA